MIVDTGQSLHICTHNFSALAASAAIVDSYSILLSDCLLVNVRIALVI